MTEQEIMQIWNNLPSQGDPTGKKFALKFAQEVLAYARVKEFQGLFDPKYNAVFTADAAREAFKHVEVKENKE